MALAPTDRPPHQRQTRSGIRSVLVAILAAAVQVLSASGAAAQVPSPEPSPSEPPAPSPQPTEAPPSPPPPPQPSTIDIERHGGQTLSGRGDGPSTRPRSRPDRQAPPRDVDACGGLVGVAGPDLGGPASTTNLERILARSTEKDGSIGIGFLRVAGPFPVAGAARWTNDWHVRRCEPYPHLHQGLDILADEGTPVVAAVDGRISQSVDHAIAGLSVEITGGDGVQYFYAHLSRIVEGASVGDRVRMGDVLGYVGATGNAAGGPAHLHLEIQPGGVPVPPKPYVDRWLAISERRARKLVRSASMVAPTTPRPREGVTPALQGIPTLMGAWPAPAPDLRWHPSIQLMAAVAMGLSIPVAVGVAWRAGRRRRLAWRQLTQAVRISAGRNEPVVSSLATGWLAPGRYA